MPKSNFRPIPELTAEQTERFWRCVDQRGPDDCWPWIGARDKNGYGRTGFNHKSYRAIRVAVKLTTGIDPTGFVVMHSCDNPPCTNPNHLSTGTDKQNQEFRVGNPDFSGENHGCSKLTEQEVAEIRSLVASGETCTAVAGRFNVTIALVSKIVRNELWRLSADLHAEQHSLIAGERHPMAKLNEDAVREIRHLGATTSLKHHQIGARFNVSAATVCLVINRRIWKHVADLSVQKVL